ncbi:MAG: aspartate-semialdehyde dehydrogenase [Candidatus Eremiobacteraeota bacterium]|nr:aspartate-semialdehyde dehydrogenase [Candidatus Eremiobacteraeota bacterium]
MKDYEVAVIGATGLVGQEMIKVLEERRFPVGKLRAFATARSAGSTVLFRGEAVAVENIEGASFKGIEFALFSGGEIASTVYAPAAVKDGAVVIDNSASFRMDPEVPLVVPEVNAGAMAHHRGIIANPNCSTIQMVVALKPIYDAAGITRIVVTTYQAVAGTGKAAVEELEEQVKAVIEKRPVQPQVYPHQIAFNVIPQIGDFEADGYSKEEWKMILETKKIFGDDTIRVTATTVRVPVKQGHCEAVNIETKRKITADEARRLLEKAPGVKVIDSPGQHLYPMPLDCAGGDDVLVGRVRNDPSIEKGIDMWIAADNLRKGAALNAVQIAEALIERDLLRACP